MRLRQAFSQLRAVFVPVRAPRAGNDRASAQAPAGEPVAGSTYAPVPDDRADPGEVVWAWVPYEEDASQGKDRPVLILDRLPDAGLVALPLTSKDHDRDADQEARAGRHWMDIGTGGWDSRGRPSEVRLDRRLRLTDSEVRRMGAALDRSRFEAVIEAAARF